MKKLDGLKWTPRWVSHMGCIKGCLNYLGVNVTDAWLYGGTGHAFVINIAEGLCPSGPTAWRTDRLYELGSNLGYSVGGVWGSRERGDLEEAQARAWDLVQRSIDEGLPCYGWELRVPEYYVVFGYDDVGYCVSGPGCDDGAGPKPWRELGDTGIGCVEMNAVGMGDTATDRATVRDALTFALEMSDSPNPWTLPGYNAGLRGYDVWMRAFDEGKASRFGTGYNAAVWAECRSFAVDFLREAQARLGEATRSAFDEALGHYQKVAGALAEISGAYPFSSDHSMDPVEVDGRSAGAVRGLGEAKDAEAAGLACLAGIVKAIEE